MSIFQHFFFCLHYLSFFYNPFDRSTRARSLNCLISFESLVALIFFIFHSLPSLFFHSSIFNFYLFYFSPHSCECLIFCHSIGRRRHRICISLITIIFQLYFRAHRLKRFFKVRLSPPWKKSNDNNRIENILPLLNWQLL